MANSSNDLDVADLVGGKLADALRQLVREEIARANRSPIEADPWVPHTRWPCTSRRAACELARSGAIEAVRKGSLWLARASAIDRWVTSPDEPGDAANDDEVDELAAAMAAAAQRSRRSA